jgi:hypothetical protein
VRVARLTLVRSGGVSSASRGCRFAGLIDVAIARCALAALLLGSLWQR